MYKSLILSALLCGVAAIYSAAPLAADDPTPRQVYQAAETDLPRAERMLEQVLRDHPRSGEAHYVAARVWFKAGDASRARSEFAEAERLEPGLPFAQPGAVASFQRELNGTRGSQAFAPAAVERAHASSGVPWGGIILALIGIGLVYMLVRRRAQMNSYPTYQGNVPPAPGAPGYSGYGAPMGGGPYYPGGGGGGLMSSLGTGLAVGAGVAAGEELVHRVLDGNHPEGFVRSANADEIARSPVDSDNMGGQDFGLSDSNSWDDSSGGGDDGGSFDSGGGGDSWS